MNNKKNNIFNRFQQLTNLKVNEVAPSEEAIIPLLFTSYNIEGKEVKNPTMFSNINEYYYIHGTDGIKDDISLAFRRTALARVFESNLMSKITASIISAYGDISPMSLNKASMMAFDVVTIMRRKYPDIFEISLYFEGNLFYDKEAILDLVFMIACEIRDQYSGVSRDYNSKPEDVLASSYLFFNTLLAQLSKNLMELVSETNLIYLEAGME